ncbi:MAG TPA: family 78 glycoside hydrolase catalytic domain [Armatimonadota bacterium]|jgi:alpha-L-rhamnosidase
MEWQAQWIGGAEPGAAEAPLLRKQFTVEGPVARATLTFCALGYGVLTVNGQPIDDAVLEPAYTQYNKRAQSITRDVSKLVHTGANVLGVTLGRGWFGLTTENVWNTQKAVWHGDPRLLLQLEIETADGRKSLVTSDASWQTSTGPTVHDSIYEGETYDARLERTGWDAPGYDAAGWMPASVLPAGTPVVEEIDLPPIRVVRTWPAVKVYELKPGSFVYDLGQNIAGWARLHVSGEAGSAVVLRYGERLRADGSVDNANDLVPVECQRDQYTLKGGGPEVWEPRFSYKGFRYVQVDGYPGKPGLEAIEGREAHTDVHRAGSFECSDDTLNAIQRITLQSILNNLHGIPTDTPVFEKNGWTGDAHLTANTALFNFDMAAFQQKWLQDCADAQLPDGMIPLIVPSPGWGHSDAPEWGSAFILMAWDLACHTGSLAIFERHYAAMARYVDFLAGRRGDDGLSPSVLGDWLPPGHGGNPPEGPQVSAACYVHRCAKIMQGVAQSLRREADSAKFGALARDVAAAVNRHCLDAASGIYHTDKEVGFRQTSSILPLAEGIVPAVLRAKVLGNVIADIKSRGAHLNTGILGTKYLLPLLTANGQVDLAFEIATQRTHPSWGFWLEQGATTLWESWDLDARSLGHHMFGMIGDWFYGYLAGIRPGQPAMRRWQVRPYVPTHLDRVKATATTPAGPLTVSWEKANGRLTLEVEAPMETEVRVPGSGSTVSVDAGHMRWEVPIEAL